MRDDFVKQISYFQINDTLVPLAIPSLQVTDELRQNDGENPFWAKVWPAGISLATHIKDYHSIFRNKIVLELGAGLGLPSIIAAQYASKVIATDIAPEAIDLINSSIQHNHLSNTSASLCDWTQMHTIPEADIILLSDVNYNPAVFDALFETLEELVHRGCLVILSTPQRLMAKPFIERIVEWITNSWQMQHEQTHVSIFYLQHPSITNG